MMLRKWDDLPDFMKCDEVKKYYDILYRKRFQLLLKRVFDFVLAIVMLVILGIPMLVVAIIIKLDSPGPVLFRQERVTTYGEIFKIHKFRTMVSNAEKIGTGVTVSGDIRVTKVGRVLRKYRIDETPQLIDIILNKMSFVGTRPETPQYVKQYTKEMLATLLMPAGITSEASIRYKDECRLLDVATDVDKVYVEQVLPAKMRWNLESIERFRFLRELLTMIRTVFAVFGKKYN